MMLNRMILGAVASMALSGCVSFAPDPPPSLLTLTPANSAPGGSTVAGDASTALAIAEPTTSARLAVSRVPVQTSASSLAYLKDAQWVERPTRLFRNLLAETMRAAGGRVIVNEGDLGYTATTTLSGRLMELGYDAATGSAIVRYDAVLQAPDGAVRSRRFESTVPGVQAKADQVGAALNQAANQVAAEVGQWVNQ